MFRRIVVILALACKLSAEIRVAIIDSSVSDTLLRIINSLSLTTDEYQQRTLGIIRASAVLLLNLIEEGVEDQQRIALFFKSISFARLDSFSLFILFKALKRLRPEVASTFLCTSRSSLPSGGAKKFSMNFQVAQFTQESCLLQILATSLECAFPGSKDYWTVERYRQLLSMTRVLMRFYRQSISNASSDWLNVHPSCLCYVKLTTSFIVLTHLCLHLFETTPRLRREMRQIQTVSQLALLLIHDIFTGNLQIKLLQRLGRPVKNRLIVVYNVLLQYNELFHFRLAQGE